MGDNDQTTFTTVRLLTCCIFINDAEGVRYGAELVDPNITLAALRAQPSASGVLEVRASRSCAPDAQDAASFTVFSKN